MQKSNLRNLERTNLHDQETQLITNDKKLRNTDKTRRKYRRLKKIKTDNMIKIYRTYEKNNKTKVIDTEVKNSQTLTEDKANNMLIPINTGLTIIMPKFLKKYRKNKKVRLAIVYTISLTIMAFSFAQINFLDKQKAKTIDLTTAYQEYIIENIQDDISKNEENDGDSGKYTVDFDKLKEINSDTKGWIKVNGIGLDFPVVQAQDNRYYLKHSFDKSYNICGWTFLDYKNMLDGTDKNIVIYGHNMRNETMFSNMTKILKPEWYNDTNNKYITFITEDEEITYEVFSIYQIKVEDYYIKTSFESNDEYQDFLNTLKSRSIKEYGIDLSTEDKIITISTCGDNNQYRIALHAKKI